MLKFEADPYSGRAAAGVVTPEVADAWARLELPRLGRWADEPQAGLGHLLRYPCARYPERVRPNTVYWPTHGGAFAFVWALLGNTELWHLEYPGGTNGVPPGGTQPVLTGPATSPGPTSAPLNDAAEPQYRWCRVYWRDDVESFQATMAPLRALAVMVADYPQGQALWAVPFVDWRYFRQAQGPAYLPEVRGQDTNDFARHNGLAFFNSDDRPGDQRDGPLELDVGAMNAAVGPQGAAADCLATYAGRRGCVVPDGEAVRLGLSSLSARHAEEAHASLAAALPAWLARLREGGLGKWWSSPDLPSYVLAALETGDDGTVLEQLPLSGLIDLGGQSAPRPNDYTTMFPALRIAPRHWLNGQVGNRDPSYAAAVAEASRLAGRLLGWLVRPFSMVLGGMANPCDSAFVGMYEWRTDESETAVHGLPADSTWWGSPDAGGGAFATYYQSGRVRARGVGGRPDPVTRQTLGSGQKVVEALAATSRASEADGLNQQGQTLWDEWGVPRSIANPGPGSLYSDQYLACGSTFQADVNVQQAWVGTAGGVGGVSSPGYVQLPPAVRSRMWGQLATAGGLGVYGNAYPFGLHGYYLAAITRYTGAAFDPALLVQKVDPLFGLPLFQDGTITQPSDLDLAGYRGPASFMLSDLLGLYSQVVSAQNFNCSRAGPGASGRGADFTNLLPNAKVRGGIVVQNGTVTTNAVLVGQAGSVGFLGPAAGSGYLLSTDATGAPQLTLLSGDGTINASGALNVTQVVGRRF
jgi:hypothetical protein